MSLGKALVISTAKRPPAPSGTRLPHRGESVPSCRVTGKTPVNIAMICCAALDVNNRVGAATSVFRFTALLPQSLARLAAWLNSHGMTGIILKYRVPRRPGDLRGEPPLGPLLDAQRAVSLVRARAAQWGINPKRIGMVGFSVGGHLAAGYGDPFRETDLRTDRRHRPGELPARFRRPLLFSSNKLLQEPVGPRTKAIIPEPNLSSDLRRFQPLPSNPSLSWQSDRVPN